jgi:hypothetical protein
MTIVLGTLLPDDVQQTVARTDMINMTASEVISNVFANVGKRVSLLVLFDPTLGCYVLNIF